MAGAAAVIFWLAFSSPALNILRKGKQNLTVVALVGSSRLTGILRARHGFLDLVE